MIITTLITAMLSLNPSQTDKIQINVQDELAQNTITKRKVRISDQQLRVTKRKVRINDSTVIRTTKRKVRI